METGIDYLDSCVNIICGCSYGCEYCWARNRYAPRFAHRCKACGTFEPHFHEERLKQIGKIKGPAIVGLNFMGDTFGAGVKKEWIEKMLIEMGPDSKSYGIRNYIILTKQPQNIKPPYNIYAVNWFLRNTWIGVSIENIDHIDRWVALSQKEYIQHKIISFEPVLPKKSESNIKGLSEYFNLYGWPEWIIIGALTKSDKESMAMSRFQAELLLSYLLKIKNRPPIFVKDNCGIKDAPKEFPAGLKP